MFYCMYLILLYVFNMNGIYDIKVMFLTLFLVRYTCLVPPDAVKPNAVSPL